MTQNINTQADHMTTIKTAAIYRLAKDGIWNIIPFGPLFTLAQAQRYQADMALANCSVLVINTKAV